jgi:hypothetical protein
VVMDMVDDEDVAALVEEPFQTITRPCKNGECGAPSAQSTDKSTSLTKNPSQKVNGLTQIIVLVQMYRCCLQQNSSGSA